VCGIKWGFVAGQKQYREAVEFFFLIGGVTLSHPANNTELYNRRFKGVYWSSTQVSSTNGWNLYFLSGSSSMYNFNKAYACPLLCLK
jgi:hypothetical protein